MITNRFWLYLLAVLLGAIATIMVEVGGKNSPPPPAESNPLLTIGTVLGVMIFPAVMSIAARKFYFWWAFAPGLATAILCTVVERFIAPHHLSDPADLVIDGGLQIIIGALLVAGPISFARYLFALRRRDATPPATDTPATASNEAGWPPAPKAD